MQALSTAVPGKWYTIKWMFGVPEVLEKLKEFKIKEGSEIHVIQNDASGMMIIASDQKRDVYKRQLSCSGRILY